MKKKKKKIILNTILTIACAVLILACGVEIWDQSRTPLGLPPPVEIVVVFQYSVPARTAEEILKPYGYFSLIKADLRGQYVVKLKGITASQAIQELQKNSLVRIVRDLSH